MNAIKKIRGMVLVSKPEFLSTLQVNELENLTITQIANKINYSFLEPLQKFQPLKDTNQTVDAAPTVITVTDLEA